MDFNEMVKKLQTKGIIFQKGLSGKELNSVEEIYGIVFPPDLQEFLQLALPVSKSFVNWRDVSEENIEAVKRRLNWPLDGMIYDIMHNGFWFDGWGIKPDTQDEAIAVCQSEYQKVPKLLPVFSHRFIPSEPFEAGNPIFSIYQTDIIYYGENLMTYLDVEFGLKEYKDIDGSRIKKIRFWCDLVG